MKKILCPFALLFFALQLNAQKPKLPPDYKHGKIPLPVIHPLPVKPDIKLFDVRKIGITENTRTHQFEISMVLSFKNMGPAATERTFFIDLRSTFGTTSGGTDYSMIGDMISIGPMRPGETKLMKYTFSKDITAMGRARQQCMIRLDCTNLIDENNEENNASHFFYITPPAAR